MQTNNNNELNKKQRAFQLISIAPMLSITFIYMCG